MRYLLLSDIHANDVALEAVLRDAERRRWDSVIFLGDLVGYYPGPERVIELLSELEPQACLLGNHDQILNDMAAGKASFPSEADLVTSVLARQSRELSAASLEFMRNLKPRAAGSGWQAVHGALRNQWEYIDRLPVAQANLHLLEEPVCFVGHTHVPKIFASVDIGGNELWRVVPFHLKECTYRIPPKARLFFNPGSVGQPRDGLPLASYAVYDDELLTLELVRVEFDIAAVQRAVLRHGYPEGLATRIAEGR